MFNNFWLRKLKRIIVLWVVAGGILGCMSRGAHEPLEQINRAVPRNIILVIGDGMGPQQLAFADLYHQRTHDPKAAALARFLRTSAYGMHVSSPAHSLVNDSACAASQLAGGCNCEPRQVGTDVDGKRCSSVAVYARQRGKKVGLISDTRITHATQAAFGAMVADRDMEHSIASQLVESDFDLLLSGGEAFFTPDASKCRAGRCVERSVQNSFRSDGRNLLAEAASRGIQLVSSERELNTCKRTPVLGLFSPGFMHDAFEEGRDGEPSLAAMTEKALQLLDNPSGFFLMVEAGQIDMAAHANDAGWVLREMLRLSETLAVLERFVQGRDDTLVVLTADHETGGMGLSYRSAQVASTTKVPDQELDFLSVDTFSMLSSQKRSISEALRGCQASGPGMTELCDLRARLVPIFGTPWKTTVQTIADGTLTSGRPARDRDLCSTRPDFYPYTGLVKAASLGRQVGAASGIVWATGTHTTTPVPVMAIGAGQERFTGWQHARDIGQKLLDLVR